MLFKKYVENADGSFIVISCADCNRPLLNIIKTEESEDVHFIKAHCVNKRCKPDETRGESWVHELNGKFMYATIKERDIIVSMEEDEDEIMNIHMGKKKK